MTTTNIGKGRKTLLLIIKVVTRKKQGVRDTARHGIVARVPGAPSIVNEAPCGRTTAS